ncbi:uncharacterized protein LOC131955011 [Physella acuta]|uniref:uncharacterized protein LOC131955011 n=1 Tax=Physella acuta TaxID=109671 RepID=UPI0027DCC245|nr:uncharacterized protein LOC131955011 [Physella acuta]
MKNLLLICGFPESTTVKELVHYVSENFNRDDILNMWIHPNRESRAVALFKKEIDVEKWSKMYSNRSFNFKNNELVLKTTTPTSSVFVRTFEAYSNEPVVEPILKKLFTVSTRGKSEEPSVKKLDEDTFEITYESGMDTVLHVCELGKKDHGKKFSLCPYFPCFRLESENFSETFFDIPVDLSFIRLFLDSLKFEDALKIKEINYEVIKNDNKWTVKFRGPVDALHWIKNKLNLTIMDLQSSGVEKEFLNLEKVECVLNQHLAISGFCLFIPEENDIINVECEKNKCKMSLHDFISSLILKEEISTPSNYFSKSKEWIDFQQNINKASNTYHVFESPFLVTFLFFSFSENNFETIVNGIKAIIHQSTFQNTSTSSPQHKVKSIYKEKVVSEKYSYFHLPKEVFLWLFKTLNLKHAAEERFPALTVNLEENYFEVVYQGEKINADRIVRSIEAHCKKVEEEMLQYLGNIKIQDIVKSYVDTSEWQIMLKDTGEFPILFVISLKYKKQMTFDEFLSQLFFKEKCSSFHCENVSNQSDWITFVKTIYDDFPLIHVSVDKLNVTLYTVSENKDKALLAVEKINKFIEMKNLSSENAKQHVDIFPDYSDFKNKLSLNATNLSQQSEHATQVLNSSEEDFYSKRTIIPSQETFFFELIPHEYKYSQVALKNKLAKIQQKHQHLCSEIKLTDEKIKITCEPECRNKIFDDLKDDFKSMYHQVKCIEHPGIQNFIGSLVGQMLVEQLSNKFKCVIEILATEDQQASKVEDLHNTVRPDYSVILLHTARFEGFNIHLVQGKTENMDVNVKVKFKPTTAEKSTITSKYENPYRYFDISLPEWKIHQGNQKHLTELRTSLRKSVKDLLLKTEDVTCFAFSTELIQESNFPFPLDTVAEILISELYSKFSKLNRPTASKSSPTINIYICESKREAVFKACTYFINNFFGKIEQPDQEAWHKVCSYDTSKYVDYRQKQIVVNVSSYSPIYDGQKALFCYPIEPDLNVYSCPAKREFLFNESKMKNSLRKIQNENPEGLSIGDWKFVKCFYRDRDAIIYCCSSWGADCEQTIKLSIEGCNSASKGYNTVYIIPPGLHISPSFPKQFLAQKVFKELDNLILNGKIEKGKKIIFVVHNSEYRKLFEKEIQSRYTSEKEHKKPSPDTLPLLKPNSKNPQILQSVVKGTLVSFSSQWMDNISKARDALDNELTEMMRNNKQIYPLDDLQTIKFEENIKKCEQLDVYFTLEKHYERVKTTHSTRGKITKHDCKLTGSVLTVFGLNKDIVLCFKVQMLEF